MLVRSRVGATVRTGVIGAATFAAVTFGTLACATPDATGDRADAAEIPTSTTVTSEPPLLDARATRFKDALGEAGLVADVPDGTLLAVARGLCDQIAGGVPEERILETVWPIAAYAAAASGTTVPGDDVARHYVDVARDTYC